MSLITLKGVKKAYGHKIILDGVDLNINPGDKIGIVGLNGQGKTSLLKIILGLEDLDQGEIFRASGLKTEYLAQNIDYNPEDTILEHLFKGNSPQMKLIRAYESELAKDRPDGEKIISLSDKMDKENLWAIESQGKAYLTRLLIGGFNRKMKNLSGGEKRRVGLAGALISDVDILFLDEPTNHLDSQAIEWLEEHLKSLSIALVMITHDRYFLDNIVNNIVELDQGKLYFYEGNYNYYLEKKLERQEILKNTDRKLASLYREELAWIKRGVRARGTKQKARIDRFEDLKSRPSFKEDETIDISIGGQRLGNKIIEIDSISKRFPGKDVIEDFSMNLLRDHRIGVVGPSGEGKSTLLKIIAGKIGVDEGRIQWGDTVKIGYFSQENQDINPNLRAIEYVREEGEFIKDSDGTTISASRLMEMFLFSKESQWTYIEKLSGGEKRRLKLLRVLMSGPNVLILDEPTNDFDIETITVLEDYIKAFIGPVIISSHDRFLLNKVTDYTIHIENGQASHYNGNYSYYIESRPEKDESFTKEREEKEKIPSKSKTRNKLSYNEKKQWETIDQEIENLSLEIESLEKSMLEYSTDYVKLQEIMDEKNTLEKKLEEKMEIWYTISSKIEEIEKEN